MKECIIFVPENPNILVPAKWKAQILRTLATAWPHEALRGNVSIAVELLYERPLFHRINRQSFRDIRSDKLLKHPMGLAYSRCVNYLIRALKEGGVIRSFGQIIKLEVRKNYVDQSILYDCPGSAILITEHEQPSKGKRLAKDLREKLINDAA